MAVTESACLILTAHKNSPGQRLPLLHDSATSSSGCSKLDRINQTFLHRTVPKATVFTVIHSAQGRAGNQPSLLGVVIFTGSCVGVSRAYTLAWQQLKECSQPGRAKIKTDNLLWGVGSNMLHFSNSLEREGMTWALDFIITCSHHEQLEAY